ncbi:hypothetical protein BRD17_03905 [Halobacteriales archaeon SW_7_68_16]|nr:MAG: hypothetical protein BRD17_03905 [Halobacteriales archaeon SW_7_68_16]
MSEVALSRRRARAAVADVTPKRLHETIDAVLREASMAPGAVVVAAARRGDPDSDPLIGDRAAGVQLIYEGLRLTRRLAHEEPWDRDGALPDLVDADIAVLAAEVLVARGFYVLADTEAAGAAVATVRAFGSTQTRRRTAVDDEGHALDRELEADALELAVVAGTTAVGSVDEALVATAREYATTVDTPLPAGDRVLQALFDDHPLATE